MKEFMPSEPNSTNRQFSPTKKDLYNHIHTAVRNNRNSEEEQGVISDLLEKLKRDETDSRLDSCWFRPRKRYLCIKISCHFSDTSGDTFLLVMSTHWQRTMLEKFGSAVLLDATYNTNKYNLPLYQLAVRTDSVYVPVGFIITEDQTTDSLQEGMEKFASLHKEWKPEIFIIDDDQREKNVIQKIFPGTCSYCVKLSTYIITHACTRTHYLFEILKLLHFFNRGFYW
ncbi:uncharacterized protein LOC125381984 [Haliotis rufescens]|uniref:uncharacterized protein LOC125381984 n=1 Tax=Haliotis rufescens TaxID=6454 RepID=UPI00201EF2BD|nr:uncharacterized protein LOC125381984 [Haliotis rufescens]